MNAGIWTFTLVGMKYNGSSAQEVKMFDELGVFSQPDNPVDKKAIIVRGFLDGEWKDLGHVSVSSQPSEEFGIPKYGTGGTVYKVVESYSHTGQSAAVHVRLELETAMKADEYANDKIEKKRIKDAMMNP